jgi:hypothetical protein
MSEWLEIYVRTMLIDINEINEENKRINYLNIFVCCSETLLNPYLFKKADG